MHESSGAAVAFTVEVNLLQSGKREVPASLLMLADVKVLFWLDEVPVACAIGGGYAFNHSNTVERHVLLQLPFTCRAGTPPL